MNGFEIALKHQVAQYAYEELLRESARQRAAKEAIDGQSRTRGNKSFEFRAAVAKALLRAGSWLMPEDDGQLPAQRGLELRLGR
jgi:hypothetical protein